MSPAAPRLKYRNIPTTLGGLRFASKAEAKRYGQLLLLGRAGEITDITVQPRFPLVVNGLQVATYVADFSYLRNNTLIVEDVKSKITRTPLYKLKKLLMKALYDIEISEIGLS